MNDHPCGGCEGKGSHWRWCPVAVGISASRMGILSQQANGLGDSVGPNEMGAANHLWAAASLLEQKALRLAQQHMDQDRRGDQGDEEVRTFRITKTETIEYVMEIDEAQAREWFPDVDWNNPETSHAGDMESEIAGMFGVVAMGSIEDEIERHGDVQGSEWKVEEL